MDPKRQKRRRKKKYTVMFVSNTVDGKTRQISLKSNIGAIIISLLLLVAIGLGVYKGLVTLGIPVSGNNVTVLKEDVELLEEEIQKLTSTNQELTEKNSILSDTISQKVELEEAKAAEEALQFVPNGVPVNSAVSIVEFGTQTLDDIENIDGENSEAENVNEENADTEDTNGENADIEDADTLDGQTVGENTATEPLVEFQLKKGGEVKATANGVVIFCGEDETYDNIIKVDHGNGYITIYRYPTDMKVQVGEEVQKGTILFELNQRNQKLGYQMMLNDVFINPMELMEIYG